MDDFPGLLSRDFGFKPQGRPAPPRNSPAADDYGLNFGLRSDFNRSSSSSRSRTANPSPVFDDHGGGGGAADDSLLFNDVFGGPPKYASSESQATAFDYEDVFKDQNRSKSSSMPVYDKPVFDEDVFEGISGNKSASTVSSTQYGDVLASGSPRKPKKHDSSAFDDLLGKFGRKDAEAKKMGGAINEKKDYSNFDDLIPEFGRRNLHASKRLMPELKKSQNSYHDNTKVSSSSVEDPFETLESTTIPAVSSSGIFTDPLEDIGRQSGTRSKKTDHASVLGGVFDDLDPLENHGKSRPGLNRRGMDTAPMRTESTNGTQSPVKNSAGQWQKRDPHQLPVNFPSVSVGRGASSNEVNSMVNPTSSSSGKFDSSDDVWLTVSEVPLFTQPTGAPPPSRPPPPRPTRPKRPGSGSFASRNSRQTKNGFSSLENSAHSYSPTSAHPSGRTSVTSQLDELEDFATGKAHGNAEEFSGEDLVNPAAAAMKEAMEKAEAKFRHARGVREREYLRSNRSKETVQSEKDDYIDKEHRETQERLDREKRQGLREEEENEKRRLEKDREEREREQRRAERERIEKERELARQAVQRATREARERAAAEARAKAQKAAAEARERAEKAAVQRVQSEARERAAAAARERANAEAREKETRASVERAAVQRAAAEARERSASQARENMRKDDDDLESIFNRGSKSSSSPRPRGNFTDPLFDTQNQRGHPDSSRTSGGTSTSKQKTSSSANFVDDLSSIFGAAPSSDEFREINGETEERRRARFDREQRTKERAAKALAEKNERDLQAQREQAEKNRIAETLDMEIKRWAAGKEGNLRALLSTLQYVLWPDCGWQPVSLTDLITAAMVKKVYRKATLCIHPDKVQQKGANLQQKYIAEKVFDLLKEAWNKFNSEELF